MKIMFCIVGLMMMSCTTVSSASVIIEGPPLERDAPFTQVAVAMSDMTSLQIMGDNGKELQYGVDGPNEKSRIDFEHPTVVALIEWVKRILFGVGILGGIMGVRWFWKIKKLLTTFSKEQPR